MRTRIMILGMALIWVLGEANPGRAGEYKSGFGFGISVPDIWLVLTRTEVADSADQLFGKNGASGLEAVPTSMRRLVYERVRAGELEMFYRRTDEPGSFVDNVNVMAQVAELPKTAAQVLGICRALPGEFSRIFGRPISMDVCEIRKRIGRRALYLEFDGAIPGTKTLHYQLQSGVGRTLVFTATTLDANLPMIMGEFEAMIDSIRVY